METDRTRRRLIQLYVAGLVVPVVLAIAVYILAVSGSGWRLALKLSPRNTKYTHAMLLPDGSAAVVSTIDGDLVIEPVERAEGTTCSNTVTVCGPAHEIRQLAVSADGRYVAAACSDGSVHVFFTRGLKPVHELRGGHSARVEELAFHPAGDLLVTAGDDGVLCAWDMKTGATTARIELDGKPLPQELEVSSDGKEFLILVRIRNHGASQERHALYVWSPGQGRSPTWVMDGRIRDASWTSDDRNILLSLGSQGSIAAVDPRTRRLTPGPSLLPFLLPREVYSDGRGGVFGATPGALAVYVAEGARTATVSGTDAYQDCLTDAAFSRAAGMCTLDTTRGIVRLWRADGSVTTIGELSGIGEALAVCITPDGEHILAVGYNALRLWSRAGP